LGYSKKPRGLAEGLIFAEPFIKDDCILYLLENNIFFGQDSPKIMESAKK